MDNINNQLFTGLIFIDITKTFDTVCHKILLSKLDHYGIRGMANDLISSFLTRKQYVSALDTSSCMLDNHYGVPQRSTLGPLLFLLYINDLSSALNCTPRLFADDTCLVVDDPNESSLKSKMNSDLAKLTRWLNANKLTINPTKSIILIIPPKTNQPTPTVKLHVINSLIPQHTITRYLGETIDNNLKFDHHIIDIEHKISKGVGIISKLRYFLPQKTLLHVYYALVHPHLLYGLPVWESTYPSYLKKLKNKVVKMIGGGKMQDSPTQFYSTLKILKLIDLHKLEIGKIVHAHQLQNKLPFKLSDYFIQSSNISRRMTRNV